MATSSILAVVVAAALAAAGTEETGVTPFESPADLTPQGKIDELVFARLKQLGIQPARLCSDARVCPPRLSGRHRHAADRRRRRRQFLADRRPRQTPRLDRPAAGARRVCRLLGHEVERSAADQGRVPHQPLAQCGAGLSPLDSHLHPGEPALRPVSSASCSPPAAAISACRQVNFYRAVQSQDAAGHRPGRGPDVHGRAGGEMAEGPLAGMAAFFSQIGYKSTARMEGGDRFLRSAAKAQAAGAPRSDLSRRHAGHGSRRTRTRARCSPTG